MPDRRIKGSNRPIRSAIRKLIEPRIAALGFTGKYPEWRREPRGEIHFLHIQTDKYGGAFSVQAGWARRFVGADWTERNFAYTDFASRAALACPIEVWNVDGSCSEYAPKSFDYRFMLDDPDACAALVASAAEGLDDLDLWLRTREFAGRAKPLGDAIGSAPNADLLRKIATAKAQLGLY